MTEQLGICEAQDCDSPAVERVRALMRHKDTGEEVVWEKAMCGLHLRDFTTPCRIDGCGNLGWYVVGMKTQYRAGMVERDDEVHMCEEHWNMLRSSKSVTIDGTTMIHDGAGNLKALPRNIGRG